ncbi:MAG: divergent polysaccharide deacetylase family protein [Bacillota bacterium]
MRTKNQLYLFLVITLAVLILPSFSAQAEKKGSSLPLNGKTVILDPGHGGDDHGYCRKGVACEKSTAMSVTENIRSMLERNGATVYMTHGGGGGGFLSRLWTKNENSLDLRAKMAGEKKADIFLSIHCNASPLPHRAGVKVLFRGGFAAGKMLGEHINRELVKLPENGKNTASPGNYYILNRVEVPAVVVETCYLTHNSDKETIASGQYREKLARAISGGVINYFIKEGTSGRCWTKPEAPESNKVIAAGKEEAVNLPGGISISIVKVRRGRAEVDLKTPGESLSLGGEEEALAVRSIVNKSLVLSGAKEVLLTVNGKPAKTLAGHIDISSAFSFQSQSSGGETAGENKKGMVAIVIDDFGQYSSEGVKEILSLDIPVTCAVMPNLENTFKHAREAAGAGHQVIVHLPLEPVRGKSYWLGPGAVTTRQTDAEIRSAVSKDFSSVPYAVGFNNHMGSAATADIRVMKAVLEVAREKQFFVLDSRTSKKTTIPALAGEMGITCVQRDVFLDEVKRIDHIKKQLYRLCREAQEKGRAVGIGHVGMGGEKTSRALREMIPVMKEMGIEFVYLSDLAL